MHSCRPCRPGIADAREHGSPAFAFFACSGRKPPSSLLHRLLIRRRLRLLWIAAVRVERPAAIHQKIPGENDAGRRDLLYATRWCAPSAVRVERIRAFSANPMIATTANFGSARVRRAAAEREAAVERVVADRAYTKVEAGGARHAQARELHQSDQDRAVGCRCESAQSGERRALARNPAQS